MKIALCSTFVPFVNGGARQIGDWLERHLRAEGHVVERVDLPEVDDVSRLYSQMAAFRWIDLDAADRVICLRPQSHMIRHANKVLWFIHHVRPLYDFWDTDLRGFEDSAKHRGIRDAIRAADTAAIKEARAVFTNSNVVSQRLRTFNGVGSTVLYPPVDCPERFTCRDFNDEVVYVSRVEPPKRQLLLIEALSLTTTPVRLRLCGTTLTNDYPRLLAHRTEDLGLTGRVIFENRWITEEEKAAYLSTCLAAAYVPIDEDSYGYATLEAAHSSKPVITTSDSGGVLEFVIDGVNGFVGEPNAASLADAMDRAYLDREKTAALGDAARRRIDDLGITWRTVVESLVS
jgi:glycosyltransferase involved in cell wall biosynthesis